MKIYPFSDHDKWGFRNSSGKTIIHPKYEDAGGLNAPVCAVKLNGKWGFIDKNDNQVVTIKYDQVNPFYSTFNNGTLFAVCLNNKWGYVDNMNRVIIPMKYDEVLNGFFEGLSKAKLNGRSGFIDQTDKVIVPFKYDNVGDFVNGSARVYLNGKTGEVDQTGTVTIPVRYDKIETFKDGIARVKLNGKYGFIGKGGKEIIPVQYDLVELFRNGVSRAEKNGNYFFIDKTGKEISAQAKIADCNCPEPQKADYFQVQIHSRDKTRAKEPSECDYYFEQLILKMSCADLKNDSKETIIQKVNCMWNKYKTKFSCESLGFNVINGNILKYTMNFNFPDFIYYLGDNYNIDFMFEDPADGKTFIEYLDEEISKTSKNGPGRISEMKEIKTFVLTKRKYNSVTKVFD